MSRSKLRDKYILSLYKRHPFFVTKMKASDRNPNKLDEMPKNRPSRLVMTHCSADISWLEDSTSFGGHSRPEGGHRRVSGLVRASLKREVRRMTQEQLREEEQHMR